MWSLEEDDRPSLVQNRLHPHVSARPGRRRKPGKHELVTAEPRYRESGGHRARPRNRDDGKLPLMGGADEPGARIGNPRGACIRDKGDALAGGNAVQQARSLARLVVLPETDQGLADLV